MTIPHWGLKIKFIGQWFGLELARMIMQSVYPDRWSRAVFLVLMLLVKVKCAVPYPMRSVGGVLISLSRP